VLERGGAAVELEPVIPLSTTGPQQTRFSYRRGAKFIAAIDGAAVVGRGLVLNRAGEFPQEIDPPSSLEKADFARVDGNIITNPLNFQDGACPVRIFDEPALLMACPTDTSFGDWMLKVPDRLAIAAEIGLDCPLLLREGTDERFIQMLGVLGWDTRRILYHDPQGVSLLPRLYTTSWPLHRWNTPMSDLLGIFRRAPAPRRAPPGAGERVYLSREGAPKRRLVNEAEIRNLFERRGFRAVKPEALDLQETRDLFANADIVAGPYGSAFLNVVHSPQPPVALVLMPPAPERYLHEIALWLGSSGSQFAYVRGDASPARKKTDPWSIPADKVEAAIDELLDLQSRRVGRSA
jgi:capsular polysaccharide biosynthesis protein